MPLAREIYQEGFRIPPVKLVRGGSLDDDLLALFLANTRIPEDRRGDLMAQLAALRIGGERLAELFERAGGTTLAAAMAAVQSYSERLMREALLRLPDGTYRAEDWLDDDGFGHSSIRIAADVEIGAGRARVDFAGSDRQVEGGVNANLAVTLAAVYYVFRCVAGGEIPANAGMMRPIEVEAPDGSVVNATFPAAVAAGNVETSQRIVDVLFAALADAAPDRVPAASCGSMSNLAFGGYDAVRERFFSYYETIAGGAGASAAGPGESAVQTHMTNTMNTPVEALEAELPVRVVRYAVRRRSGGRGRHRGGNGVDRELELLSPAELTVLSERRTIAPHGSGAACPPSSDGITCDCRVERAADSPARCLCGCLPEAESASRRPAGAAGDEFRVQGTAQEVRDELFQIPRAPLDSTRYPDRLPRGPPATLALGGGGEGRSEPLGSRMEDAVVRPRDGPSCASRAGSSS